MTSAEDRIRELERELEKVSAERDALARQLGQQQAWHAALARAPVGVLWIAASAGRYRLVNRAFADLVGHTREAIEAIDPYQFWVDATHPDDLEAERLAIESVAKGEVDGFELDKRLLKSSGEMIWVRAHGIGLRDDAGRLEDMVIFFSDLQKQRDLADARDRLESQLRQSQKLEALGKLAGGVAHDFNNRLVIIMGYTELLKRALPSDGQLVQHADLVLTSCQRAADLTRQLLAYSRRQVLRLEAFDLNDTVERMRQLLARLMGDHIELATDLAATSGIFSDPGQIEQVILNLAINARDAMPQGGRLQLETHDVQVTARDGIGLEPGKYVMLVVRDSGTGISNEALPHIFEPFFTTKEIGSGTGLGLSMVEGIVHQSGGTVKVHTELGKGTAFRIYLPEAREAPSRVRHVPEPAPPRALEFETVLVCDDDEDVRRLLVQVLGFRAYRVLQAGRGSEALDIAQAHDGAIHLLVTDLVMPGMSGVELATALRARHPDLSVLYLSGYTDNVDLPLDERTRFLAKPFLPRDLTHVVASMLEHRAPAGARGSA